MYNNHTYTRDSDFEYTTTSGKTFKITNDGPIIGQIYQSSIKPYNIETFNL